VAGYDKVLTRSKQVQKMTAFFEKIIIILLLLAVVFSALAHGVVDAWSVALLEILGVGAILLWSVAVVFEKGLKIHLPSLALPVVAFLVLGLLHCIAFKNGEGELRSLSADVEATRKTVFLLFFLCSSFLIAANLFVEKKRLYALVNFLIAYGMAMAMFALLQFFTWNGRFYWLKPNTQSVSPFGPFVSHNHFAGYMEMLIPLAIAMTLARGMKVEARLFYGFSALVMSTASVASLSRGGMISLAAMLLFIAFCKLFINASRRVESLKRGSSSLPRGAQPTGRRHPLSSPQRRMTLIKGAALVAVVTVAVLISILWVGPDRLAGRMASGTLTGANNGGETFFTSRGWIWKDSWAMIKANPIFGVGIGAFQTAYPQYSHSDGALVVGQAHNDYLQILSDAGIIGGLIALWFIVLVFREIFRALKSRDVLLSALALGSGAGIFAILVHSIFDFNLQLPSNVLLFLILAAILSQTVKLVRSDEDDSPVVEDALALSTWAKAAKSLRR
jgi:O-antigen ligase